MKCSLGWQMKDSLQGSAFWFDWIVRKELSEFCGLVTLVVTTQLTKATGFILDTRDQNGWRSTWRSSQGKLSFWGMAEFQFLILHIVTITPKNLRATPGKSDILVNWEHPEKETWHGELLGYYVGFKRFRFVFPSQGRKESQSFCQWKVDLILDSRLPCSLLQGRGAVSI